MKALNLGMQNNNLSNPDYCEEDKLLLVKCADGDNLAWQKIIKKYGNLVLNLCFQFTGNFHIAEDLTQDIFIKVFNNCFILSKHPNFKRWIIRTTRNRCLDYYRKNKMNKNIMSIDSNQNRIKNLDTPESKILLSEKLNQLHQSILQLPISLRSLIILRDINGHSYEDIAKILRMPIGTVKSRLNRARNELFKILGTFKYFNSL